jgi:hypothetical protein
MKHSPKKSNAKKPATKSSAPGGKSPKARHSLVVSVKDDHLHQIDEIAQKLKKKGYLVDQVMKITGGIKLRGSGDPEANKRQIKEIAGVDAVEVPIAYAVAPPESDIQ